MMAKTAVAAESQIVQQIRMVLPSPSEWRCNGNKGGGQVKAKATKRVMAMATRVASNNKDNGNGNKVWRASNSNKNDGGSNNCRGRQ